MSMSISIGIMSTQYGYCKSVDNQMCDKILYNSNKSCWNRFEVRNNVGKGFKRGETVKVMLNKEKQHIQWKVG